MSRVIIGKVRGVGESAGIEFYHFVAFHIFYMKNISDILTESQTIRLSVGCYNLYNMVYFPDKLHIL